MKISSTKQVFELADQKYAWPGGYEMYFICKDGGILCADCVIANKKLVKAAPKDGDVQWHIIAMGSEADTDDHTACDHCNRTIIEDWHEST